MYLKGITTSGFKSFADKLELKLDGKITCIVGPNGSGKSNVVDAVRWVLGEQSVKSLRGDGSMSDVIFSGSKSRSPLNVASVELIFDNNDHYLNIPYTEISIKRRVYRSGENEYYLNNEKCRLKDINNLLMDSGMGKESFNIISQGEVDKILSNSSQDRRVIFEEASGIIKYKKRKEEALRKLDRTHNNIDRVNDIIAELEMQIGPLKEQSAKAEEYLENKKGLDTYEVALLAYDIENLNNSLENAKKRKEKIDGEILNISNETSKNDAKYIEDNNRLEKLEQERVKLNQELLKVTEEKEKLDGERKLLKERSKTTKEENVIKEEIRNLIEEREKLSSNLTIIDEDLKILIKESSDIEEESNEVEKNLRAAKAKKNMYTQDYSKHNQDIISTNHKITNLKTEIEQGSDMPNSVRKVLKNTNLTGIHNTIGNILTVEEKYTKALNTAISSNKNFIITKDEESAKRAINYLKDNHLGRATFFPLTVIKPRYADSDSLNILKDSSDFLGVMSDLVTYNNQYDSIIKNQLGTVLVTTNIDAATRLSHLIKARYKFVTLEGDVVNVGGSLTGGSQSAGKSVIILKQELKYLEEKLELLKKEEQEIQQELQANTTEISAIEEKSFEISKTKVTIKEKYDTKKNELLTIKEKLIAITKEHEALASINNNSISEKEEELIKQFHEKTAYKEQIEIRLASLNKEVESLKEKLEHIQAEDKLKNHNLRNLEKESRELEITINRSDVKLDSMLETLSAEYELTYERAKNEYSLDIEPEEARAKVNSFKANIKRIGMVNLDSIAEYERVNTRYVFLTNQREDLISAEDTLLEIMNEMDEVMKEEFKNTFEQIRTEFQKVFKELFTGGTADLKLTDKDDLLTTGIDIVASPPGKKLTTISLLSGGEKTLTAISLLFAILNVRTVPFCLFDEVEAALDEANVNQFGKYLNHYKDKTQFLIITHKKKTMEYANTLYGITMQESGVSKLVSVKLEDHEELL
ncbi:MAG: AAA family ATPase [Bacilli bacterium]|nr:AAA family ATPase [Bacilli bacterium]